MVARATGRDNLWTASLASKQTCQFYLFRVTDGFHSSIENVLIVHEDFHRQIGCFPMNSKANTLSNRSVTVKTLLLLQIR